MISYQIVNLILGVYKMPYDPQRDAVGEKPDITVSSLALRKYFSSYHRSSRGVLGFSRIEFLKNASRTLLSSWVPLVLAGPSDYSSVEEVIADSSNKGRTRYSFFFGYQGTTTQVKVLANDDGVMIWVPGSAGRCSQIRDYLTEKFSGLEEELNNSLNSLITQ